MKIGFYYFDTPPTLRNDHVVSVNAFSHVQINEKRALVTVDKTDGTNGVFIYEYDSVSN